MKNCLIKYEKIFNEDLKNNLLSLLDDEITTAEGFNYYKTKIFFDRCLVSCENTDNAIWLDFETDYLDLDSFITNLFEILKNYFEDKKIDLISITYEINKINPPVFNEGDVMKAQPCC